MKETILTINAGSSSIKFALYRGAEFSETVLRGKIERIGNTGTTFTYTIDGKTSKVDSTAIFDFTSALQALKVFLETHVDMTSVAGIGHRIVHGMERGAHALVTPLLITELKETSLLDPEHMPFEIAIVEMFMSWHSEIPQVVCFDTVFHHDMPRVAQMLSLPRRFESYGMKRYGFHGLSCAYLAEELFKLDSKIASGRTIIAHLGNGASVTALENGKSVDTSMGFTPAGGIPMSSRMGDIDPGVLWYAMKKENLSLDSLSQLINHESGLMGISETSSDMLDLLNCEASDTRAKEAVDLFCYEVKKRIGAYAAVLGGVDTLIFTGGMGENASRIRRRICAGLGFLGITLDDSRNDSNAEVISIQGGSVCVRVIHTNEELMIARITSKLINQ